jgi:hypothetical protein
MFPEVSTCWEDNAYEPGRVHVHGGISAFECPVPRSRAARDLMVGRTLEEGAAGARHRTNLGVHDGTGHRSGDRPGGRGVPLSVSSTLVRLVRRDWSWFLGKVPRSGAFPKGSSAGWAARWLARPGWSCQCAGVSEPGRQGRMGLSGCSTCSPSRVERPLRRLGGAAVD